MEHILVQVYLINYIKNLLQILWKNIFKNKKKKIIRERCMTEMEYIYFVHVYTFYKKFIRSGNKVQVYCGKSSVFFCCFLGEKPDVRRTLLRRNKDILNKLMEVL